MSYRLGVDVGGTFTDLLLFEDRSKSMILAKVPSTPGNQALGIMAGLERVCLQAGIEPGRIDSFLHGTTVATNAILEGKGARTAAIVTAGFRDVLQIMRQDRPKMYDFFTHRPAPLVPRHLRFELTERVLHTGEIHLPLDDEAVVGLIRKLRKHRVESVAVCLLHSYANPVHELHVKRVLARECPDIDVSISHEIMPEIKEYERMSTTAMNACVVPIVGKYLADLRASLDRQGVHQGVHIMQSSGGIMPSAQVERRSVSTILSGPAAGVLGGVALAKQAGIRNAITVDMGGTSFDVCLAHEGKPKHTRASEIGGHALSMPMIDIHAIGAGGGSVAWMDAGGVLKVGPGSAGAFPGPVCYGKGGTQPTVTDANLVLNRLDPDYFLGGEMAVDRDAACRAIDSQLAAPLGMGLHEVAEGIVRVVNANMARGIRFVSVMKGYDPRDFTMVCFGGNGPLHGAELADELGIPQVLVPFAPGVNCAYGLLVSDFRHDFVRTWLRDLADVTHADLTDVYAELEHEARDRIRSVQVAGKLRIVMHRSLDMRYQGQGYELEVPVGAGELAADAISRAARRFHALHKRTYGFAKLEDTMETVNARVTAVGVLTKPKLRRETMRGTDASSARKGTRSVFLRGENHETSVYDRAKLDPGASIEGPAVIEQKDSTVLLFPGQKAHVDAFRNIVIRIKDES